jgi:hypothetical protein
MHELTIAPNGHLHVRETHEAPVTDSTRPISSALLEAYAESRCA